MFRHSYYYSLLPVDAHRKRHILECLAVVSQLDFHVLHTASVKAMDIVQMVVHRKKHAPTAVVETDDENVELNEEEEN